MDIDLTAPEDRQGLEAWHAAVCGITKFTTQQQLNSIILLYGFGA